MRPLRVLVQTFAVGWMMALVAVIAGGRPLRPSAVGSVLVLGTRVEIDGVPNPCLRERVRRGAELAAQVPTSTMIVSGGVNRFDTQAEAEAMAKIAAEFGVAASRTVIEDRATSTVQNLIFGCAVADTLGQVPVVAVTSPYHVTRTRLAARLEHLDVTVVPSRWCRRWGWVLREPAALAYYQIRAIGDRVRRQSVS